VKHPPSTARSRLKPHIKYGYPGFFLAEKKGEEKLHNGIRFEDLDIYYILKETGKKELYAVHLHNRCEQGAEVLRVAEWTGSKTRMLRAESQ